MAVAFERVIIVMLENATRDTVLKNTYMNALRQQGVFLKNSFGLTHPSQPNYIAMTGGDTFGITTDDPGWARYVGGGPDVTTIVDLIEARPTLSWKAYAEDLDRTDVVTSHGQIPDDHGCFVRRHVPFLSYPSVVDNPERSKLIVNAQEYFEADLRDGKLPSFAHYTPGIVNDGHSLICAPGARLAADDGRNIDNIAKFLQKFLGPDPLAKFPPETLVILTFDEAYPYDVGYNIYTLLIGDMLERGTTRNEPYNHYSLLRSIEDNFRLGSLDRNDASARPYWFLAGA
jgi:hypothetical protein